MRTTSLLALALSLGVGACPVDASAPVLPDLPQLEIDHFLPSIRQQVQRAYVAARANPTNAAANGKLGMVLDAYEQYQAAAVCYQRARLLEPDSFRWLYYLGSIRAAQGDYGDAAEMLTAALQRNPGYVPAQLKLAESLLATGKWDESGRIYEAIVNRYPDSATAYYGLGRVWAGRGNHAAAAESFRKACELFPPYGASHYALALACRKLGQLGQSQEHFKLYEENKTNVPPLHDSLRREIVQLNQGALAHVRRGVDLEQAGKIKEAITEHEKALEVDPNEVQAHVNLIGLYGRLGQVDRAEQHYRAAVSLNPNQAQSRYDYGVLLFRQHQYAEAQKAFQETLEINPFHAEARHNLGFLFEQQGQIEPALKEYERAVEDRPNYRLAHFHIGRILVNQRKYDEAVRHFLQTLTPEDADTPGYLYALAAAYGRAGQREAALKYARQARAEAVARGQSQLLASIDKDLRILEQAGP